MARLKGPIQFTGKIGELVAYERDGEVILRSKSSLNKKRIATDPAFERTRESNQEFGGASNISKFLRNRWFSDIKMDKDSKVHHRLNSKILKFIHNGEGIRGRRSFKWTYVKSNFIPFNINAAIAPNSYMGAYPEVERMNDSIKLNTQGMIMETFPEGATHFKVFARIENTPDFAFNEKFNKYTPEDVERFSERVESTTFEVSQAINADLEFNGLTDEVFAVCFGIEYFQETNGDLYKLSAHPFAWIDLV